MPNGSSAKTSRDTSLWDCPQSLPTYQPWALAQKRACFRRLKSARPTYAAGSSFWPTPTLSLYCNRADLQFSAEGMRFRCALDQTGKQLALGQAARIWSMMVTMTQLVGGRLQDLKNYPYSRPLHLSLRLGSRSSIGDWTFNPNFSDWIMGWPIGWTDPTRPVTGWSAWLQRMRIALSELPSAD